MVIPLSHSTPYMHQYKQVSPAKVRNKYATIDMCPEMETTEDYVEIDRACVDDAVLHRVAEVLGIGGECPADVIRNMTASQLETAIENTRLGLGPFWGKRIGRARHNRSSAAAQWLIKQIVSRGAKALVAGITWKMVMVSLLPKIIMLFGRQL